MASIEVKGLTAKIEATAGVDANPTPAADGVQLERNFFNNLDTEYFEDNLRPDVASGGMGLLGSAPPSGRSVFLEVAVALKGVDAALAAAKLPEWDVLMRIAGVLRTDDFTASSENVVYTPRSDGFETATVYAYTSGAVYKLVFCVADVRMEFNANQLPMAVFSISGKLAENPSDLALPAITYPEVALLPQAVKNAGLTLNGFDPSDFTTFALATRNVIASKSRGNASDGHAGFEITGWDPIVETTIDLPTLASFNPYQLADDGTEFAWDLGPIGATQYNRVTLSGTNGRLLVPGHSDQDRLAMLDLEMLCMNSSAGNDAWSLTVD